MIKRVARWSLAAVVVSCLVPGAVRAWDPEAEKKEVAAVEETLASFRKSEPGLKVYFENAYGYAVFPTVGKGGIGVGGAYGKGRVYVGGKHVGNTSLTQASIGLQLGYESFSELVFFSDKAALENFKSGKAKFAANATAYAIKAGAATVANYNEGVAVFVKGKGGLMADASLGGQSFSYEPVAAK